MLEFRRMHPAIPHLVEVQRVDLRIAVLRGELDSFPKRIREADAKLSGARAEVAAAKEAFTKGLTERKKFELDVEQWKERARKYRDQSGAVKTNEAYKALQHEIANAEAEMAKAEDRQLEHLMAAEVLDRRVKAADAALKDAEKMFAAERKQIDVVRAERETELKAALAERNAALAPVPEDLRDLYTRIAKRHHGLALAESRNEQCRGCGMRVLPHIYQELRDQTSEKIFLCETCGGILYFVEPPPAPNPATPGENAASAAADPRP